MLCAVSIMCGRFEGSRRSYSDLWDAMQRQLQAKSMPHPARQLLAHIPSANARHGSMTGSAHLPSPDQRKKDLSSQPSVGPREHQPASVEGSPDTFAAPLASTTARVARLKQLPTARVAHCPKPNPPCTTPTTRGGHHQGANSRPGPPQQTADSRQQTAATLSCI